ncbi:hypothetical protein [Myroides sp. DW712]|uniref:hypothetical protein n=1 Tax=Myroides sp. DW712 TaxID=3389800 RepID=UPI0039790903
MKKVIAILLGSIALASCSSDDNKSSSDDPVFSQPYTELTSLDELQTGKYQYVGNKIGDRKVGLVPESHPCKYKDYLFVHRAGVALDSITYDNYRIDIINDKKDCSTIFEFPRLMQKNNLVRPGYMKTSIDDGYIQKVEVIEKGEDGEVDKIVIKEEYRRKNHYSGEVEIGFQAGYLRIEDRLSDYNRLNKDEKVYLYFKKN